MDLREYLFRAEKTAVAFAAEIGYSEAMIRGIAAGRDRASRRLCKAIAVATEGAVSMDEVNRKTDLKRALKKADPNQMELPV